MPLPAAPGATPTTARLAMSTSAKFHAAKPTKPRAPHAPVASNPIAAARHSLSASVSRPSTAAHAPVATPSASVSVHLVKVLPVYPKHGMRSRSLPCSVRAIATSFRSRS